MGKVDTDNGYTIIANQLMEAIPQLGLNGTQLSIIMIVMRYTYGFHRKEHKLSLSFLANATGKHKMHLQKEVKRLMDMKILIEQEAPTFNSSRIIGFNKDIDSWELVNTLTVSEIDTVSQTTNATVSQDTNTTVSQDTNQERKNKESIKDKGKPDYTQNDYKSVYEYYLSLNLIKHRTYTNDMSKAIKKAMDDNKYSIEYCKTLLDRHQQVVKATKNLKYPVKARSLSEFFGQKAYEATHLICADYDEGGKYYEEYIKAKEVKQLKPLTIKVVEL